MFDHIPLISITANSIPKAFWEAMFAVCTCGYEKRTEYDRKDEKGNFIDPPSKDARVAIEILNPFAEPRFPVMSYCERGKYIAEFLGAKDHLVVPLEKLMKVAEGEKLEATEWPYTYHQRLFAYPRPDGSVINQVELQLDRLAKSPMTRRAIIQTGIPYIDAFLGEDLPCLREIQLRTVENEKGELVLSMVATWRSRDLYKAWADNLLGITNLQRYCCRRLEEKTGRKVVPGKYMEFNGSLHIYGQDFTEKGADKFLKNFPSAELFLDRCWTSDVARDMEIIPQLEDLLLEETWNFGVEQKKIIQGLIDDFKSEKYLP